MAGKRNEVRQVYCADCETAIDSKVWNRHTEDKHGINEFKTHPGTLVPIDESEPTDIIWIQGGERALKRRPQSIKNIPVSDKQAFTLDIYRSMNLSPSRKRILELLCPPKHSPERFRTAEPPLPSPTGDKTPEKLIPPKLFKAFIKRRKEIKKQKKLDRRKRYSQITRKLRS